MRIKQLRLKISKFLYILFKFSNYNKKNENNNIL